MNRREFTKAMLACGAGIPFGITRAAGQTRGGTLNTIIQPEPPVLGDRVEPAAADPDARRQDL